jgi:hypothetical protein
MDESDGSMASDLQPHMVQANLTTIGGGGDTNGTPQANDVQSPLLGRNLAPIQIPSIHPTGSGTSPSLQVNLGIKKTGMEKLAGMIPFLSLDANLFFSLSNFSKPCQALLPHD